MKNIKRIICAASILAGLLLFAACGEHPDVSYANDTQADTRSLLDSDSRIEDEAASVDEEGFEWISIFNEDGTMENIRVPVAEKDRSDKSEEDIPEPDFVVIKTFDGEKWVDDSSIQGVDGGTRGDPCIVLLIIGDGFTSSEVDLFEEKAIEARASVVSTYPYNLFSKYFTII
jgi:hypothetical protein